MNVTASYILIVTKYRQYTYDYCWEYNINIQRKTSQGQYHESIVLDYRKQKIAREAYSQC